MLVSGLLGVSGAAEAEFFQSSTYGLYLLKYHRVCSELVVKTKRHVLLQFGEIPSSNTSLERDSFTAWVECHTQHIRALSEYRKRYVSALKNFQDDQVVAESMPAIWQTYANRPDVDSARLASQAHRSNVCQLAGRDEGGGAKLEDYVKFLERFQQSLVLEEEHEGGGES